MIKNNHQETNTTHIEKEHRPGIIPEYDNDEEITEIGI